MSMESGDMEKDYIILTNRRELKQKAEELGYEEVRLLREWDSDEAEIVPYLKKVNKNGVKVLYRPESDERVEGISGKRIRRTNLYLVTLDLYGTDAAGGRETLDQALKNFPPISDLEKNLRQEAFINEVDHRGRCGNCHAYMQKDDRYCRYCGAEKGRGKFLPFKNHMPVLYGAPVKKKFRCPSCGKVWIGVMPGVEFVRFCPDCGTKAPEILEEFVYEDWLWSHRR